MTWSNQGWWPNLLRAEILDENAREGKQAVTECLINSSTSNAWFNPPRPKSDCPYPDIATN